MRTPRRFSMASENIKTFRLGEGAAEVIAVGGIRQIGWNSPSAVSPGRAAILPQMSASAVTRKPMWLMPVSTAK